MSSLPSDITVPGRPEVHEVSAGIYAYIQPDGTWWINNTGFLTGPQGVISIDSCATHRRTRAYQAAIAAITPAPVRTVVNTHHHGDHTFGNCLFPAAAIVGHESARAEALAFGPPRELPFWDGPDWGELTLDPPFVTFTDEIAVHAGDLRASVRHVGTAAHTTNDSIVWIPDRSVLFCGDLIFNGGTPFLLMGSVAGAVEVLEQVVAPLGARLIVPGHGPVFEGTGTPRRDAGLPPVRARGRGPRPGGRGDPARRGPGHRPGPVRRLGRPRADRRQPAPGLRRTRRDPARRAHRRAGRAGRHGRLQRRRAAHLPGVIHPARAARSAPRIIAPDYGSAPGTRQWPRGITADRYAGHVFTA